MKQNEENSQKAQMLTQEELENVNGGFIFKKPDVKPAAKMTDTSN